MNEEIKVMTAEEIETRGAELKAEIENADETRLNEIEAELKGLEERKKEIEIETRKADMIAVASGAGVKVAEAPQVEERKMQNTKEYMDAYANYIKTGDDRECRALLTTNVSGVVPVPDIVDEIVRTAWDKDDILSRVKRTSIKGNLKVAFELSADGAYEHTEGTTAPTEESLQLGIVTMIPKNIKKWITISDEAVALGGEAFLRYVYDEQ